MVRRTVACSTARSAFGSCVSQQLGFGASGDAPETHQRTTSNPPQMPNEEHSVVWLPSLRYAAFPNTFDGHLMFPASWAHFRIVVVCEGGEEAGRVR